MNKTGAQPRKGTKYPFGDSDPDKEIVSMIEWQGFIYVATKKGVYRIEDDKMVRLEFVDKDKNNVLKRRVGG